MGKLASPSVRWPLVFSVYRDAAHPYLKEVIDPDFTTNLFRFIDWPDPSFPGYPSGHFTFASAAGGVFRFTFGNATNFTDRTHVGLTAFRVEPRSFSSFEQLVEENALLRIPLGVHADGPCGRFAVGV